MKAAEQSIKASSSPKKWQQKSYCKDVTKLYFNQNSGLKTSKLKSGNYYDRKIVDKQVWLARNEPRHKKTPLRGFRPGNTQTSLRSHRN